MKNKLIIRLSNEIGNQMFMYASAYAISKELNRKLYIDNETAFLLKKNISKFGLNYFEIKSDIAPDSYKFKNLFGYIRRKFYINSDSFRKKKKFYIEKKDINKISNFSNDYKNIAFANDVFIEGHFESEKYFINYKDEILNEFKFKNINTLKKCPYLNEIREKNTVSICIRQNRFIEGRGQDTLENKKKSWKYTMEQINYINKATNYIKNKISNPKFFLWTNDFTNISNDKFNFPYKVIDLYNYDSSIDKRVLSLYLLTQCNHFVVTASTFNWWGAWLSKGNNKIVLRPSSGFFSNFYLNNSDFWPSNWSIIDEKI